MGHDEEAFRAFAASRRARLLRAAYLLTGDPGLAEDLVQTALFKTALRWRRIAASGDPEPYVRRILYTEHVSTWRRRGAPEVLGAAPPERVLSADDPERRLVLQAALSRLTAKQRAVLVLRYYEDLTEPQAAAVLGCAPGTVKSQTRHALMRLRQLAPELADEFGSGSGSGSGDRLTEEVAQ
jgi:RNA polymerase sigma-70 factor (sigma-E family)